MAGYFQTLMQSYGPGADAPAPIMPIPDAPAPEPLAEPAPAQNPQMTERSPDRPPLAAGDDSDSPPERGHPDRSFEPFDFENEPDAAPTADAAGPTQIERVTERLVERVQEQPIETSNTSVVAVDASVTNLHQTAQTDVHLNETHLHKEITHIETAEPQISAETPAAPALPETQPDHPIGHENAMLDTLEAHLAKAFANIQQPNATPPLAIVDKADFEPADDLQPPMAAPEVLREVTKEIVTEVHHHHETRAAAPAKRAPRTAAEASQIGRIRFNSPWDDGGGF